MTEATAERSPTANANRLPIIGLILSFVLPVLLAALAFYTGYWEVRPKNNKGYLIHPPLQLKNLAFQSQDGKVFTSDSYDKKWWLVYPSKGSCEKACQNSLFQMRQTRLASGPLRNRIELMMVQTATPNPAFSELIGKEFSEMTVLNASAEHLNQQMKTGITEESSVLEAGRIYVMDPMGFIMLSYPAIEDEQESILKAKDILKDLKKLLKESRIG